jgi:hypothetical protein
LIITCEISRDKDIVMPRLETEVCDIVLVVVSELVISSEGECDGVGVGGGVMVGVCVASAVMVAHEYEYVGVGVGGGVTVQVVVAVVDVVTDVCLDVDMDAVGCELCVSDLVGVGGGVIVDVMDTLTDSVPVALPCVEGVPTVAVKSFDGDALTPRVGTEAVRAEEAEGDAVGVGFGGGDMVIVKVGFGVRDGVTAGEPLDVEDTDGRDRDGEFVTVDELPSCECDADTLSVTVSLGVLEAFDFVKVGDAEGSSDTVGSVRVLVFLCVTVDVPSPEGVLD